MSEYILSSIHVLVLVRLHLPALTCTHILVHCKLTSVFLHARMNIKQFGANRNNLMCLYPICSGNSIYINPTPFITEVKLLTCLCKLAISIHKRTFHLIGLFSCAIPDIDIRFTCNKIIGVLFLLQTNQTKERCIIKKGQTYIDDVLHLPMPYANVLLLQ